MTTQQQSAFVTVSNNPFSQGIIESNHSSIGYRYAYAIEFAKTRKMQSSLVYRVAIKKFSTYTQEYDLLVTKAGSAQLNTAPIIVKHQRIMSANCMPLAIDMLFLECLAGMTSCSNERRMQLLQKYKTDAPVSIDRYILTRASDADQSAETLCPTCKKDLVYRSQESIALCQHCGFYKNMNIVTQSLEESKHSNDVSTTTFVFSTMDANNKKKILDKTTMKHRRVHKSAIESVEKNAMNWVRKIQGQDTFSLPQVDIDKLRKQYASINTGFVSCATVAKMMKNGGYKHTNDHLAKIRYDIFGISVPQFTVPESRQLHIYLKNAISEYEAIRKTSSNNCSMSTFFIYKILEYMLPEKIGDDLKRKKMIMDCIVRKSEKKMHEYDKHWKIIAPKIGIAFIATDTTKYCFYP